MFFSQFDDEESEFLVIQICRKTYFSLKKPDLAVKKNTLKSIQFIIILCQLILNYNPLSKKLWISIEVRNRDRESINL